MWSGWSCNHVFFFFTLVTGPRRSLSLKLSDTRLYEPQIYRATQATDVVQFGDFFTFTKFGGSTPVP